MKRKLKKKVKILLIVFFIIFVSLFFIINSNTTKNRLKKIGYNKNEINILETKLDKKKIKDLLKKEYDKNLALILNEKYYIPYNLEEYINYAKKESDINKVISIVNVKANKQWYSNPKETNMNNEYNILVNKYNFLNKDYIPNDLVEISNWYSYGKHKTRKIVYNSFKKMFNKAKEDNLTLLVNSGYRTYEEQEEQYNQSGDEYASRPGFSEHQTGLALDVITYNIQGNDFENTDEFKWLQDNAHKYGFILRYPKNKEYLTGYSYESWHYRYLGIELATKVKESELTYDEYYAYYCEYKKEC